MNLSPRLEKLPKEVLTISILCDVYPNLYMATLFRRCCRSGPSLL
jgi:hypothetical protein